jgi:ZIP family zinc transporter
MIPSLTETIVAGVITMLSNGIGGLPFVFVREFPINVARLGWSIAGGMMLSASVFNLIIPGVSDGGITPVAIGVLIGTVLLCSGQCFFIAFPKGLPSGLRLVQAN